jgi:hypothetical protein
MSHLDLLQLGNRRWNDGTGDEFPADRKAAKHLRRHSREYYLEETVKVREVSDGHLELVFDDEKNDDNIYKKSRPGKKYGNFPGETRHCPSILQN